MNMTAPPCFLLLLFGQHLTNDFDDAFAYYQNSWPRSWAEDDLHNNIFSKWPQEPDDADPWLQPAAAQHIFQLWRATFNKLSRSKKGNDCKVLEAFDTVKLKKQEAHADESRRKEALGLKRKANIQKLKETEIRPSLEGAITEVARGDFTKDSV